MTIRNHTRLLSLLVMAIFSLPPSLSFVGKLNDNNKHIHFQPKCPFLDRRSEERIRLGVVLENVKSSSSNSDSDSEQLVNITPLLEMNKSPPSQPNYSKQKSLGGRTRCLLKTTQWDEQCFEEAQSVMKAWSHRQSRKAAATVERIIRRIVQEQKAGNSGVQCLDMATMYTCAIKGWANSWEKGAAAQRAEEILDTMQRRYMGGDDDRIKPGIECFNLVLLAYARSGLPDAPQQALRVLGKLHEWYSNGSTDVTPNKESYATVLRAFARTGKPEAPEHVKRLLEHLEELSEQEGYSEVKPNYLSHGAYIGALVDSLDRDHITGAEAAEKAEIYLYQMLNSSCEDAQPDSWCFNMVLTAWSRSGSLEMVERVEAIMKEFEDYHERRGHTEKTKPNTNSYNCMIASYSRSNDSQKGGKALAVLRKMQELFTSGNNTSVHPDVITYNTVMNAYAKSRQRDAPYKVEQLLREMHELYEETGDVRVRPNSRSFNTCVDAWAKSNLPGAAARIMDWIVHMQANAEKLGRRSIRPNKWTFNAFLQALSKSGEPTMGEEAEEMLNQMVEYYDKGWVELKPDVLTFTNVIHCIAVSGREDSLERSLAIVRRMEDLHEKGYGDVRPNTYTYNCVINAAAKSKRPGKAQIALQILRRMQSVALRPLTVTYNNVLNACAYANHPDEDRQEILDIAKFVFEEAKTNCGANYITYAAYLRVIGGFVDDMTKRLGLIREIFRECCEAGQLSKLVMTQIKFSVPPRHYAEFKDEAMDDKTGKLRQEYTINARMVKMLPSNKKVSQ